MAAAVEVEEMEPLTQAEGVATLVTVVATVAARMVLTAGLATLQVVVEQRTMVAMVGQ